MLLAKILESEKTSDEAPKRIMKLISDVLPDALNLTKYKVRQQPELLDISKLVFFLLLKLTS